RCHQHLHSFPTRRSSDLEAVHGPERMIMEAALNLQGLRQEMAGLSLAEQRLSTCGNDLDSEDVFSGVAYDKGRFFLEWMEKQVGDRKSTRLNSSHVKISY